MRYFARIMLVFLTLVFLLFGIVGCGYGVHRQPQYAVTLSTPIHSDSYDEVTGIMTDVLNFSVTNEEMFSLDCKVILSMHNSTNSTAIRGSIGIVGSGESKAASFPFEMLFGETELSLRPECTRP